MMAKKPVVLCILDGWGIRDSETNNAIAQANTPCWDHLMETCPHTELQTSGLAVGLPEGQMGNSEVGHMNIGSGRIVMQSLPRIDQSISSGELQTHPLITESITSLQESGRTCHIMGLLSDGGVHAHQSHIIALASFYAKQAIAVAVHVFTDGRDTAPGTAEKFVREFEGAMQAYPSVRIATVSGRYYAMDRDNRWERVKLAYDAIVQGEGKHAATAIEAVADATKAGQSDEFIEPYVIGSYPGALSGDVMIMANFRADRARQITSAICAPDFDAFERKEVKFSHQIGMVEYSTEHNEFMGTLFPAEKLRGILGEVVASHDMHQLRIAETEKYAHVTFFFNGGEEKEFKGEDRILVPSPKVATYDLQPEMSAPVVTEKLEEAIASGKYELIVVNYANTDMVGHTGSFAAAMKAVEAVDRSLEKLVAAVNNAGGIMLVTADHGNVEQMLDDKGQPHTQHTTGPVPLVAVGAEKGMHLNKGRLCDIAPTILAILGLPQPEEMTGVTLIA